MAATRKALKGHKEVREKITNGLLNLPEQQTLFFVHVLESGGTCRCDPSEIEGMALEESGIFALLDENQGYKTYKISDVAMAVWGENQTVRDVMNEVKEKIQALEFEREQADAIKVVNRLSDCDRLFLWCLYTHREGWGWRISDIPDSLDLKDYVVSDEIDDKVWFELNDFMKDFCASHQDLFTEEREFLNGRKLDADWIVSFYSLQMSYQSR